MFEQTPFMSPDQVKNGEDYQTLLKSMSIRLFEIVTLLCSITDDVGTPSSLSEKRFDTQGTNFQLCQGIYNIMHGKSAQFPTDTYKYAPEDFNTTNLNNNPPVDMASEPARGVGIFQWSRIRQNLTPRSVFYRKNKKHESTFRFSPHISEAIYQVENVLAFKKAQQSEEPEDSSDDEVDSNSQDNTGAGGRGRGATARQRGAGSNGRGGRGGGRGRGNSNRGGKSQGGGGDSPNKFNPKDYILPWNFKSVSLEEQRYVYCNWKKYLLSYYIKEYSEENAPASAAASKEGYFGVPNKVLINLPKLKVYVIFLPVPNSDQQQALLALQILDPHYDAVALFKFIQQRLLRPFFSIPVTPAGMPYFSNIQKRERQEYSIPGLDEGFINETYIFPENSRNNSIANHPKFLFDFLFDYYCMSHSPDDIFFKKDFPEMAKKCQDMSNDPNIDYYSDVNNDLNPNRLFSLDNAINFLRKDFVAEERGALTERITKIITEWDPASEFPNNAANANIFERSVLSPCVGTDTNKTFCINLENNDNPNDKIRGFVFESQNFRWCYFSLEKKRPYGLVNQFMPHCVPLFELEQKTHDALILKLKTHTEQARKTKSSEQVRSAQFHGALEKKINRSRTMLNIFKNSSGGNKPSETLDSTQFRARWKSLFDAECRSSFCEATALKVMPDNQFKVGLNSFLLLIHILEVRVFSELDKLKPKSSIGHACFSKMYIPSDIVTKEKFSSTIASLNQDYNLASSDESYYEKYFTAMNNYVFHLVLHRNKVEYFMEENFFNPNIFPRIEKNMADGWKAMIAFIKNMKEKSTESQIFNTEEDTINHLDPLSPCYYSTMTYGMSMRSAIDSVCGSFMESLSRRLYEQTNLYQNNLCFYAGVFGSFADVFKIVSRMKFHQWLEGSFAVGKSWFLVLLESLCVPGIPYPVQKSSKNAWLGTGFETDQIMFCKEGLDIIIDDSALVKSMLTDHCTSKSICNHNSETGDRNKKVYEGSFLNIMVGAHNLTMKEIDEAMASRFHIVEVLPGNRLLPYVPDNGSENEDLKKIHTQHTKTEEIISKSYTTVNFFYGPIKGRVAFNVTIRDNPLLESERDFINLMKAATKLYELKADATMTGIINTKAINTNYTVTENYAFLKSEASQKIKEYWNYIQLVQFYMNKLQAVHVINNPSEDFYDFIRARFRATYKVLNNDRDPFEANQRVEDRLKILTFNICEWDAIERVFFDETSPYFNTSLSPNFVRGIEFYLSPSFEHFALAASIVSEELVDNTRSKILICAMKETGYWDYCKQVQEKYEIPLKEDVLQADYSKIRSPNFEKKERTIYKTVGGELVEEDASGFFLKIDKKYCQDTGFNNVNWGTYSATEIGDHETHSFFSNDATTPIVPPTTNTNAPQNQQQPQEQTSANNAQQTNSGGIIRGRTYFSRSLDPLSKDTQDKLFYDTNKISLTVTHFKPSMKPEELVTSINMLFQKHKMPEIGKKFLEQELKRMSMTIQNSETLFDLVRSENLQEVVSGKTGSLFIKRLDNVTTNDQPVEKDPQQQQGPSFKTGAINNTFKDRRILICKYNKSQTKEKGAYKIQVMFDVKALQHINENHVMIQTLENMATKLPLYLTRIPLLFHKAGGRLSYIHVGDTLFQGSDTKPFPAEKLMLIRQDNSLDEYRKKVDYGLEKNDEELQDNSSKASGYLLSNPYLDVNDYYRALHIINGGFAKIEYDKEKGHFYVHLPDYRFPDKTTKEPIEKFFDSRCKTRLWKQMLTKNEDFRTFFATTTQTTNTTPDNVNEEEPVEIDKPLEPSEEEEIPDQQINEDTEYYTGSKFNQQTPDDDTNMLDDIPVGDEVDSVLDQEEVLQKKKKRPRTELLAADEIDSREVKKRKLRIFNKI